MRSELDTVDCKQLSAIDSIIILSQAGSTLTQKFKIQSSHCNRTEIMT